MITTSGAAIKGSVRAPCKISQSFTSSQKCWRGTGCRTSRTPADRGEAYLSYWEKGLGIRWGGSDVPEWRKQLDLVARREGDPCRVAGTAKGCGQIGHFERRLNTETGWSNSGFWVVRLDGSATDFSYIWAVKCLPGDRSKDFYGACQEVVALDLVLAKKRAFAEHGDAHGLVACELTGVMVSIDDAPLDHAWPNFSHIVSGWSGDIPDGIVSAPADGQTTPTFVDKAVADAFRDYHHNQAMLRILSKSANLQTGSQARRPKIARPARLA